MSPDHSSPTDRIGYAPGVSAQNNVISFLERVAGDAPGRRALLWSPRAPATAAGTGTALPPTDSLTFGELASMARNAAAGLRKLGIGKGDRVFLFVPMSPQLYVTMFAIQRLGAAAVFLDSWARADQVGQCIRLVNPKAMIAPEKAYEYARNLPELALPACRIVVGPHSGDYATCLDDLVRTGGTVPVCPVAQEDTALITFTTGSSGIPKGADRTHRFLAAQHEALERELPYTEDDVDMPVFPIFSLNNMAGGVTTVLPAIDLARPAPDDGAVLHAQVEDLQVTSCTLSPSLLRGVAGHAARTGRTLASLRRIATGGAPISSDDVAAIRKAAPHARVVILYGSTEVEPIALLDAEYMPAEGEAEGVCVGSMYDGLRHALIRVHRGPVKPGPEGLTGWKVPDEQVGELVVSGEHVCRSYYRNPDAVATTKITEPDGTLWHRTGDLCRFDEDGRLWIVGRVHNAIQRAGTLLFPVKAEVLMKRLPFVDTAAYLGLPDEKLGERAVAAFALRDGIEVPGAAVAVRQALHDAGVVTDEVRQVTAIPLDPRHNSKVEYTVLRAILQADTARGTP